MLVRWDECSSGFKVRDRVVAFTPLDVCFGVGICIVGEAVTLNDVDVPIDSHTKRLFDGKPLNIESINDLLLVYGGQDSVEDFCRLYVLLAFAEFLMPVTTESFNEALFKFVDHVESLDRYVWGNVVYDSLVCGLTRAFRRVREKKNLTTVHITGCVALLQVWAGDHLSLYRRLNHEQMNQFPRVRKYLSLHLQSKKISQTSENNLIIGEVDATSSVDDIDVVRQALRVARKGFSHWSQTSYDIDGISGEQKELRISNAVLRGSVVDLQCKISIVDSELTDIKQQIGLTNFQVTLSPSRPQTKGHPNFEKAENTQLEDIIAYGLTFNQLSDVNEQQCKIIDL